METFSNKSILDNQINFFYILSFMVPMVAILSSMNFIGPNIANAAITILIVIGYGIHLLEERQVEPEELFFMTLTMIPLVLNLSVNMVSITLVYLLFLTLKEDRHADKYLKVFFMTSLSFVAVALTLYFLIGFNAHSNFMMWRIDRIVYRQSLGFAHANIAMMTFISVFFSYLGIITKEWFRLRILLALLITLFFFYYTQSRTSTYVIVFMCMVLLLLGKKTLEKAPKLIVYGTILTPSILSILSMMLLRMPRNKMIDQFLSGRQNLYKLYYSMNDGFHWYASPELENAMFDNAYLHALLAKGIVFSIFLLVLYTWMIRQQRHHLDYIQCLVFVGYCMIAFTETSLFKFELFLPVILVLNRQVSGAKSVETTEYLNIE